MWRREEITNPMLISKCCHDIDFLLWLTEALPQTIVVRDPALVPGRERPEGKHAPVHRLPAGKGVPLLGSGPLL